MAVPVFWRKSWSSKLKTLCFRIKSIPSKMKHFCLVGLKTSRFRNLLTEKIPLFWGILVYNELTTNVAQRKLDSNYISWIRHVVSFRYDFRLFTCFWRCLSIYWDKWLVCEFIPAIMGLPGECIRSLCT